MRVDLGAEVRLLVTGCSVGRDAHADSSTCLFGSMAHERCSLQLVSARHMLAFAGCYSSSGCHHSRYCFRPGRPHCPVNSDNMIMNPVMRIFRGTVGKTHPSSAQLQQTRNSWNSKYLHGESGSRDLAARPIGTNADDIQDCLTCICGLSIHFLDACISCATVCWYCMSSRSAVFSKA